MVSGRYRVHSLIAKGGMSEVYLAEHVHIRKAVAIKVLRPDAKQFTDLAAHFEREAIAGAHIEHDNVAKVTDFGWLADGSCFVAMEYVEGTTLSALIARGPIPAPRVRRIVRQIAEAVAACHALGVIHRDLKPGNIMVDEANGDLVKVIDFGLAKVPLERVSNRTSLPPLDHADAEDEPTRRITLKNVVFGTVTYMPPEIMLGMDAIDERSDLYALGTVLYEMLAGRPAFELRDPRQLLIDKRHAPPPIRHRAPGVNAPAELERIAHRLLAPSPAHRFQSATALVAALDAEAESPSDSAWLRASSTLRLMPAVIAPRQLGRHTMLGLVVSLLVGAAAAFLFFEHNTDPQMQPLSAMQGVAAAAERVASAAKVPKQERSSPIDLEPLRDRFIEAHRRGRVDAATSALMDAVEAPEALAHEETRRRAGALAALLDFGEGGTGTALFAALVAAGPHGWDVLYEVLSTRGGTEAAERATAILAEPELRAQLSPALRIALELRETRCRNKPKLFERAAAEGDERARIYLGQLRSARCKPRRGECCFHRHRGLKKAIDALR